MKISAPASCGPTREIALLIAEPSPALRTGTDVMSALVSGATSIMIPTPNTIDPGKKSVKYEAGGKYVLGSPSCNRHGVLSVGTRANHRTPTAMITGPIAMNQRGPNR